MVYLSRLAFLLALVVSAQGNICMKEVCKFELTVSYRRSMTYSAENGATYNVELNQTTNQLQVRIANAWVRHIWHFYFCFALMCQRNVHKKNHNLHDDSL